MFRIAVYGAAAATLLVVGSFGASAQQPAPSFPGQNQMQMPMPMERGHGMGGMGQGTNQGQSQGQGGGMGGMGQGGMMDQMQRMHQGPGTPPSSAHAPTPQATPQCPAGTTIQMDDKGQHLCK